MEGADQRHLKAVAGGVDVHRVVEDGFAKKGGIDIPAAAEHKAVKKLRSRFRCFFAEQNGQRAGHGKRAGIGCSTLQRAEAGFGLGGYAVGRNGNNGTIVEHGNPPFISG